MTYRCALLGCGPRANGHADAYTYITRGALAAVCDLDRERLDALGDKYGVAHRYTDLDEMLAREKPDIVQVVTPPTLRVSLMTRLSAAGVPGVIVEKPICIGADDYRDLHC